MKGIYLTQEGKQEIENQISELERQIKISESLDDKIRAGIETFEKRVYEKILSSAIILPVEESWKIVAVQTTMSPATESYPQGVIIQPKQ
jgi:hypothetical protein